MLTGRRLFADTSRAGTTRRLPRAPFLVSERRIVRHGVLTIGKCPSYDHSVNESWVLVVGDVAWPFVVLVIAVVVLSTQRRAISGLISRVRSLKYPGGEAELAEASVNVISTLVDTLSRDLSERTERTDPVVVPAEGPADLIENREPIADFAPLPTEEVSNLVMLRTKVSNLLSELAVPPPPGGFGHVPATIEVLRNRAVLDTSTAQALKDTMDIADDAARGAMVPRKVAQAVENSGPAILDQLALLRTVAAARFEDHVLSALRDRAPTGWVIDFDRAIPRDEPAVLAHPATPGAGEADGSTPAAVTSDGATPGSETDAGQARATPMHARVDALVTADTQQAVVEVRARLQPGARAQIDAVLEWLRALPPDLPVLLVILGDGLTARELQRIRVVRPGRVELLLWDHDSDELIVAVRELMARPGGPAAGG